MWHAKEVCLRSQHVYANTLFSINDNLLGVFTFSNSVKSKAGSSLLFLCCDISQKVSINNYSLLVMVYILV